MHGRVRGAFVREIRDAVEADQVDAALEAAQQAYQRISVALAVVEAGKHRVLEADATLAAEIVLPYQADDVFEMPGLLDRHHLKALGRERIVETDRKVAMLPVKKFL